MDLQCYYYSATDWNVRSRASYWKVATNLNLNAPIQRQLLTDNDLRLTDSDFDLWLEEWMKAREAGVITWSTLPKFMKYVWYATEFVDSKPIKNGIANAVFDETEAFIFAISQGEKNCGLWSFRKFSERLLSRWSGRDKSWLRPAWDPSRVQSLPLLNSTPEDL